MSVWFITGCSSGIGKGIAEAALEGGHDVVITARNKNKVEDLEKQYPDHAFAVELDVVGSESIDKALSEARARFGRIDVLVNNAGYGYRAAVEESERDAVEKMFATNFYGPMELIHKVLPEMRKRGNGVIINVTSMGAVRAAIGNGYYSASKAALALVTDALYKEAGPLGIQVMNVEPGAFRTNFYDKDSLLGTSIKIADYAETAGKWHVDKLVNHHDQAGDPQRAGKVIVSVVEKGKLPKHLPLGSDSVQAITNELKSRLEEIEAWAEISAQTDYKD